MTIPLRISCEPASAPWSTLVCSVLYIGSCNAFGGGEEKSHKLECTKKISFAMSTIMRILLNFILPLADTASLPLYRDTE